MKRTIAILTLFLPLFGVQAQITKSVGVDGNNYLVNPTNFGMRLVAGGDGITVTPTNFSGGTWGVHIDATGSSSAAGNTIYLDSIEGNDNTASLGGKPFQTVSNAVAAIQNNTTLIIRKGLYPVTTFGFKTNAPLKIYGKTNVTIIGEGQPRIQASGVGSIFSGGFCSNLNFYGFEVSGVNDAIQEADGDQTGAWWLEGPIRRANWENIGVLNMKNQGIVAVGHPNFGPDYEDFNFYNNYFFRIGFTNSFPSLPDDGTAIGIHGRGLRIVNNIFTECLYSFENSIESGGFEHFYDDILIEGNRSYGSIKYAWNLQGTNINRLIFKNNITIGYATNRTAAAQHQYAMILRGCNDCEFKDNIFAGTQYGIVGQSTGQDSADVMITGNIFTNIDANAIDLFKAVGEGRANRRFDISRNMFNVIGGYGMQVTLDNSSIEQNTLNDYGTAGAGNVGIALNTSGMTNGTNVIIAGNKIRGGSDDDTIVNGSKARGTRIYGNLILAGNAISDLGASTQGLDMQGDSIVRGALTNTGIAHLQSGAILNGSVYNRAAPTNNVTVTNQFGVVHLKAASVLACDFNQSHEYVQTNRSSAAQSIILTNAADGQTMSGILLGEVSGGTSRVMTFVPHSGQLIEMVGDYTTGLATSLAITLTNGLAVEWSSKVRRVNGTNIHHFAAAYYKY